MAPRNKNRALKKKKRNKCNITYGHYLNRHWIERQRKGREIERDGERDTERERERLKDVKTETGTKRQTKRTLRK